MKIILFRHGEKQKVDSVKADDKRAVRLTDLGIEQITKLGNILRERFPDLESTEIIYSSAYTRAIQSAEIVQLILKIKNILLVSELGEFMATNNYLLSKEIREEMQEKAMKNPDWVSPDVGFSLNQKVSSFENKLKEICQKSKTELVLVSTHGAIIRNTVYNLKPELRPNTEAIAGAKIHEAGYTVLDFDGDNFRVEEFDVHDYL